MFLKYLKKRGINNIIKMERLYKYYCYYDLKNGSIRVLANDEEFIKEMTKEERKNDKINSYYKMIDIGQEVMSYDDEGLKSFRKAFYQHRAELERTKTKRGKYDFKIEFMTRGYVSVQYAAITIFKRFWNKFDEYEKIESEEYNVINKCYNGGMLYFDNEVIGKEMECFAIDFTSYYADNLREIYYPKKKGEFYTISEFEDLYGYYHCTIHGKNTEYFMFSPSNWYHYYSIKQALEMGLEVRMIKKKNNCYLYNPEDLVHGGEIFGEWFETMTKIRDQIPRNKLLKVLISSLWGALSFVKHEFKKIGEITSDVYEFPNKSFDEIDDNDIVKSSEGVTNFNLRINGALPAYGRYKLLKFIKKTNMKNIIKIQTDGIVMKGIEEESNESLARSLRFNPKVRMDMKYSGKLIFKSRSSFDKIK